MEIKKQPVVSRSSGTRVGPTPQAGLTQAEFDAMTAEQQGRYCRLHPEDPLCANGPVDPGGGDPPDN